MLSPSEEDNNNSSADAIVNSFVEEKKSMIKSRICDSVGAIVDEFFGDQYVQQMKEMLKKSSKEVSTPSEDQPKSPDSTVAVSIKESVSKAVSFTLSSKAPQGTYLVYAVKSKPYPSTSGGDDGQKRTIEQVDVKKEEDDESSVEVDPNSQKRLKIDAEFLETGDEQVLVKKEEVDEEEVEIKPEPVLAQKPKQTPKKTPSNKSKVTVATSNKSFPCPEEGCDKVYSQSWHLKKHSLSHLSYKPFGCSFQGCTYESRDRYITLKHIRNVHLKGDKNAGDDGTSSKKKVDPALKYLIFKEKADDEEN